jgi:hypothetical protein
MRIRIRTLTGSRQHNSLQEIHKRLEPENVVVFVVIDEKHVQGKIRKGQIPTIVHVQHSLALFDMDNTYTAGSNW